MEFFWALLFCIRDVGSQVSYEQYGKLPVQLEEPVFGSVPGTRDSNYECHQISPFPHGKCARLGNLPEV